MKLVNSISMVKKAQEGKYAIPAFNINGGNYDITRAALESAQEMDSPLILQVYEPNCHYRGFKYVANLVKFLSDDLGITVPTALHLDHGKSLESITNAIHAGFTGVMLDASHKPLEENIALLRKAVEFAHPLGVAVEAEVGYVKGNESPKQKQIGRIDPPEEPSGSPLYTKIKEASHFIKEVEVDLLAVSVGTTHGVFKRQTKIDFNLLDKIHNAVSIPLVQHGTGGISLNNLSKLAKGGMSKINFGEPFRYNFIRHFYDLSDNMEHLWQAWKIQQEIKELLKVDMVDIIKALGSGGKAS